MRRWSKRLGYLIVVVLWILLVSFPVVAFLLATQGQIEIGDASGGIRLFLLQDADNRGLGFQWTRSYDNPNPGSQISADCARTTLRYFLWDGDASGQNLDYCQCTDPQTGQSLPVDACTLP